MSRRTAEEISELWVVCGDHVSLSSSVQLLCLCHPLSSNHIDHHLNMWASHRQFNVLSKPFSSDRLKLLWSKTFSLIIVITLSSYRCQYHINIITCEPLILNSKTFTLSLSALFLLIDVSITSILITENHWLQQHWLKWVARADSECDYPSKIQGKCFESIFSIQNTRWKYNVKW